MNWLRTRMKSGYQQYQDPATGEWHFTHRRAVEKKLGGPLPPGLHVHHIDGNNQNNRGRNLIPVTPAVHHRLHHVDPGACFRCGRSGHVVKDCYAVRDVRGAIIPDRYRR